MQHAGIFSVIVIYTNHHRRKTTTQRQCRQNIALSYIPTYTVALMSFVENVNILRENGICYNMCIVIYDPCIGRANGVHNVLRCTHAQ